MGVAANPPTAAFCPRNSTTHDGTLACHWTGGPVTRGTLNIFWLCMSTLGICVWSAVHPGTPHPGSSRFRFLGSRVSWLLVGLFMPEMLVLTALGELREAITLLAAVERADVPTEFPWWMHLRKSWKPQNVNTRFKEPFWMKALPQCLRLRAHAASIHATSETTGNPRVRIQFAWWMCLLKSCIPRSSSPDSEQVVGMESLPHVPSPSSPADRTPHSQGRTHPWTLTHSFYAVMGGYYGPDNYFYSRKQGCNHDRVIDSLKLALDDPNSIPDVSAGNLDDRSKASGLAKLLLVWQLFVFLANCAARWKESLPLSLLETTTISHSFCSLVALLLWWYKPHSVTEVTIIGRATIPKEPPSVSWHDAVNTVLPGEDAVDVPRTIAIFAIAALYGFPHVLGLSVDFPSSAEEVLWEMATFVVIGLPLITCILLWIVQSLRFRDSDLQVRCFVIILIVFSGLYAVCGMFLVAESLRQIFVLPEGSFYGTQLSLYLPSFS